MAQGLHGCYGLGPEAIYKDVRCVKYERSPGEVNKVLYIPCYYHNSIT